MPAFEIIADAGDAQNVSEVTVSSITASDGDLLELDLGATAWTVADSSTQHWQRVAICQGAIASSDTVAKVILVNPWMKVRATATNNSSATHNGDRMVLSSQSAVNNTGTDSTAQTAVFVQTGVSGATADNKIIGHFVVGTGVDPDAT